MAKVKVRVKATPVKARRGTGTLIARVPVAVTHTDRPRGPRLYGGTVRIIPHIKTNSRGEPRRH